MVQVEFSRPTDQSDHLDDAGTEDDDHDDADHDDADHDDADTGVDPAEEH
jgi:hypothetical protein